MDPLLLIDGYKLDHRRQYPPGTQYVYSNWTPRMSRVPGVDKVVFFGLQYFLDQYLGDLWSDFFLGDIDETCARYQKTVDGYLGPNGIGVDHLRDLHDLGYLPLLFRAIPEGRSVPLRVPAMTVENTHPRFYWLVNYLETVLSNVLWMPCTSATVAKRMRELLVRRARTSGEGPEFVDWQGHDFSYRGMAGFEAAYLSGAAHLISFKGTDTMPALAFVDRYYPTDQFVGGSVAATEHSVMCAGGEDDERATYERLLDLYPTGIVSIVSDTWDFWNVLTTIVPSLKARIMARDGKVVIRPDSGDPVKIVCGDPEAPAGSPERKGAVELLWDTFGGTTNAAGFKMLDPHVGVIYGDSINYDRADAITAGLMAKGFASTNIVFGMGSYGYQYQTRDTFGFAMKATWCRVNCEERSIFKKPKTDNGTKNSAKGRVAVLRNEQGELYRVDEATQAQEANSELVPVWQNGQFIRKYSFDQVRANARAA